MSPNESSHSRNEAQLQDEMNEMIALAGGSSEDKVRVLLLNDEVNSKQIEEQDEVSDRNQLLNAQVSPELNEEMNEMILLASDNSEDKMRVLLLNDELNAVNIQAGKKHTRPQPKPSESAEAFVEARRLNEEMNEMISLAVEEVSDGENAEDKLRVLLLNDEAMKSKGKNEM